MSDLVTSIPIIILAAGQSSRMRGQDKLLQIVEGVPLVRRQAQMARKVTKGDVIVALPPEPHARHDALRDLEVRRIAVEDAQEGMNRSLRQAFAALKPNEPAAMLLLGDLPDLQPDDLAKTLQAVNLDGPNLIWRGSTETGQGGHPIVFSAKLFPRFADLTGDDGACDIVCHAQGQVVSVPLPGNRARADLDTPEDWANWRARNNTT